METTAGGPGRYSVCQIEVPVRQLSRFGPLLGADRYAELLRVAASAAMRLEGRTVVNVNSTASGGGVAEMLDMLVGYVRDAGIDVRWDVLAADAEFFSITKRLHNRLHGVPGDAGDLEATEARHYAAVTAANATSALGQVRPGDVVLLHDPQTAGMAAALSDAGARVVWRCHVGRDGANRWTDGAWSFLRPHLSACEAYVFSRLEYAPRWMDPSRVHVIPPSIDPFSPKNQELSDDAVVRILRGIGLLADQEGSPPGAFVRSDGSPGRVGARAAILRDGPPLQPGDPLVVQVSRWDHLKDMVGVMEGFARAVPSRVDAHLALVGPQMDLVADDPEGAAVFAECVEAWQALPDESRHRVQLVCLPMEDVEENAAMVNALQRHATVIVQKSLREGFGLTVAEAMWKGRAVIASRVGGIIDQVAPGTGILLEDPGDLDAFATTLADLLVDPEAIARLGHRAHQHVLAEFVTDVHLERYAALIEWMGP